MSERKINLEEILKKSWEKEYSEDMGDFSKIFYPIFGEMIKNSMKEAIKKALELAAENAKIKIKRIISESGTFPTYKDVIDVDSILNTINQIE